MSESFCSCFLPSRMEGRYKVEEAINFGNFLRVMGVTDDETLQEMIQAHRQVWMRMIFGVFFIKYFWLTGRLL